MKRSITALVATGIIAATLVLPSAALGTASEAATATARIDVAPYFWVDEAGHPNRTGPFLLPVQRRIPATLGVGRAALEELLAGPKASEANADPAISTQIPDGTKLRGLTITNGKAKVHLNAKFAGDDDSAAAALRAAQVVFTLTRYPTVDRVVFFQGNNRIKVQTSDGELKRVVTRDDYMDLVAAISVETPVYRGRTQHLVRVSGVAAVFEATFNYALRDAGGNIIEKGIAMSDNGTGWGTFDFTIHYDVASHQRGTLKVWDFSAKDGSRIDVRKYPVILTP
jgi:Immunoglobulin-like domain of bacterial spore germination/Sporulation and spore germination